VKLFTIALLLALVAPCLSPAQSAEEALKKLETDWGNALVKKDFTTLEKVASSDWTWIDPEGTVWSKTQSLAVLKSGEDVVSSFVLSDMTVRVYGNAAVVTGVTTSKETLKGKDVSGTYRFTDTWVKRGASWQCVATHSSKVTRR
jgi:ketosteroid isomerase-like protein